MKISDEVKNFLYKVLWTILFCITIWILLRIAFIIRLGNSFDAIWYINTITGGIGFGMLIGISIYSLVDMIDKDNSTKKGA